MPVSDEERQFDIEVAEFSTVLRKLAPYRDLPPNNHQAYDDARIMLSAKELLAACEYAHTFYGSISSEDFSAGGDRPAREKLNAAIAKARLGYRLRDNEALAIQCAKDVREAVRENQLRTT